MKFVTLAVALTAGCHAVPAPVPGAGVAMGALLVLYALVLARPRNRTFERTAP